MSSIRGMLKQAQPQPDEDAAPKAAASAEPSPGLGLPPRAPEEARRPMSTRMRPGLQRHLKAMSEEFRDAGYSVTVEMILEQLVVHLRDDEQLRSQVVARLLEETR